jgi:hypothetical protein
MTKCQNCDAELSWRDCDVHPDDECYATDCETPFGCGSVERDCDARYVVARPGGSTLRWDRGNYLWSNYPNGIVPVPFSKATELAQEFGGIVQEVSV